jgi:hypothetical protein
MPRVLRNLRIDEISSVDKAAGEGTRVVLMKRDAADRAGFYHRLFAKGGSGRVVRPPRRLRGGERLRDIADAKHALLHSPDGRSLLRDVPNASVDELAQHLLEASSAVTNKRNHEVTNMDLIEVCKSINTGDVEPLSEHELTTEIQKFASKHRRDSESAASAFSRILTADDETGLAFRKAIRVAKRAAGFPV